MAEKEPVACEREDSITSIQVCHAKIRVNSLHAPNGSSDRQNIITASFRKNGNFSIRASLITLARNINETNGDLQICEHFIPKVFGLS